MSDRPPSGLEADVAMLVELLDACIAHHEGRETLALVASVRTQAARKNWAALAAPLAELPPHRVVTLVRACVAYFHAANIAEQVHRADELTVRASGDRLGAVIRDVAEAAVSPEELTALLARLDVRLVLTAHPTESARRSILAQRARLAEALGTTGGPGPPTAPQRGCGAPLADRRAAARAPDAGRRSALGALVSGTPPPGRRTRPPRRTRRAGPGGGGRAGALGDTDPVRDLGGR